MKSYLHIIPFSLFALAFVPASASISTSLRMAVADNKVSAAVPELRVAPGKRSISESGGMTYYPVIIKLSSPGIKLPEYVTELHRRGALVLATVEERNLSLLENFEGAERVEANSSASTNMIDALKFCEVSDIIPHTGNGGEAVAGLTGRGVVTGLCDIGIEPNHATFFDLEGNSRFKKVVTYGISQPTLSISESPTEIAEIKTDDPGQWHATHVAGIMAGNGMGTGYSGIATGSELVSATGDLYDAFLLAGCEEIVEYAKSQGKPAVINMSISSTIGPHDGTSLFNQYMEEICKEATVCISAGNDGYRNCYAERTLASDSDFLRTYIRSWPSWSALRNTGYLDIWGPEGEEYRVDIICMDFNSDNILRRYKAIDRQAGKNAMLITSGETVLSEIDAPREQLLEGLEGYVYVESEINPENGRMNVAVRCNYRDLTTTDSNKALCVYGIEVTGSKGTKIEVYTNEDVFLHRHWDKQAMYGNPTRSINDFCTGLGPICVGAFTSQNRIQNIDGEWMDFSNISIGDVAYFSSYATLNNGTVLPHICAPGAQVISSISSYCIGNDEALTGCVPTFKTILNGKEYYFGTSQGTSMSSPYAAGVFALWLEEDPSLTADEIKTIAIETADKPGLNPQNPQWGTGILNARRGLEKVRQMSGIANVDYSGELSPALTPIGMNRWAITGEYTSARITSVSGAEVETFDGSCDLLDLSGKHPGVYIISFNSSSQAVKVLVR